ncbi:MAG: ferric enterobactin receptor, partial [Calditrichaeota bacterium]
PITAEILKPFQKQGVGQAQFFANAVDTDTKGLDIVASYAAFVGEGRLSITAAGNFTKTTVDTTNVPKGLALKFAGGDLDAVRNTIFNREERNRLEDALPHQKVSLSARYSVGPFSGLLRATYFGSIKYRPTNPQNDETFGAKTLFDVDLAYQFAKNLTLSIGANNVFNTFPDKHKKTANYSKGRFPYSRRVTQFGMNGGFYYTRLQLQL